MTRGLTPVRPFSGHTLISIKHPCNTNNGLIWVSAMEFNTENSLQVTPLAHSRERRTWFCFILLQESEEQRFDNNRAKRLLCRNLPFGPVDPLSTLLSAPEAWTTGTASRGVLPFLSLGWWRRKGSRCGHLLPWPPPCSSTANWLVPKGHSSYSGNSLCAECSLSSGSCSLLPALSVPGSPGGGGKGCPRWVAPAHGTLPYGPTPCPCLCKRSSWPTQLTLPSWSGRALPAGTVPDKEKLVTDTPVLFSCKFLCAGYIFIS